MKYILAKNELRWNPRIGRPTRRFGSTHEDFVHHSFPVPIHVRPVSGEDAHAVDFSQLEGDIRLYPEIDVKPDGMPQKTLYLSDVEGIIANIVNTYKVNPADPRLTVRVEIKMPNCVLVDFDDCRVNTFDRLSDLSHSISNIEMVDATLKESSWESLWKLLVTRRHHMPVTIYLNVPTDELIPREVTSKSQWSLESSDGLVIMCDCDVLSAKSDFLKLEMEKDCIAHGSPRTIKTELKSTALKELVHCLCTNEYRTSYYTITCVVDLLKASVKYQIPSLWRFLETLILKAREAEWFAVNESLEMLTFLLSVKETKAVDKLAKKIVLVLSTKSLELASSQFWELHSNDQEFQSAWTKYTIQIIKEGTRGHNA